jgi:excisionase family DNA binding protein
MSTRLLSIKQAAAETGISEWTLRDLIATGDLPVIRPPKLRRVWIDRRDLDRALESWKERGNVGPEVGDTAGTRHATKAH